MSDFNSVNESLIQLFHDITILEEQFLKNSEYSDVTLKELQELCLIHKMGNARATDIAKNQRLSLSTITITLNRLETKGYISRKKSKMDRRVIDIVLTEKGNALCDLHRETFKDITEKLLKSVFGTTEEKLAGELEEFHDFLEKSK